MHPEELREVMLALRGSTESFPFGPETPVFKFENANKVFAILSTPGDPNPSVTLKCNPLDSESLREQHPAITPGYHMNKRHWITVALDGSVPDELLVELAAESHRLVSPKLRSGREQ